MGGQAVNIDRLVECTTYRKVGLKQGRKAEGKYTRKKESQKAGKNERNKERKTLLSTYLQAH